MGKESPNLRIHIYVQHLLGGGHLVRMKTLAAALANAGHRVTLISGGLPGGGEQHAYSVFQLPAVKTAPHNFSELLGADGAPVSENFKAARAEQLRQFVAADAPEVLLIETFPFGRRALRFELVPLLRMVAKMNPRPLVLCSLRDILQLRTPERYRQTVDEVNAWFDHVLVHADPAVAELAETFPLAAELGDAVLHTGYVYEQSAPVAPIDDNDAREVIVSAGGGAVGLKLLQTAIAAQRHSHLKDRVWRLLAGANLAEHQFNELQKQAGEGIVVERNRADFAALLAKCAVSVSQAGYNTVLDTVAANCRAVLAPYSQYGETEQPHRAEKFARLGRAVVLNEGANAEQLAAAVDRAMRLDLSQCRPVKMDGALQTVRFIERQTSPRQAASNR